MFTELPLGSLSEPVNDLQFAVSWPSISSDMLNDDSNFSDLNPEYAPQWWLKVGWSAKYCESLIPRICTHQASWPVWG